LGLIELPFSFPSERVAAMRGLENRISHQNRQTRRSPAHSRHNKELRAEKAPQYAMCCDGNIRFPSLVTDFAATHKAYPFPV
jgi:hypothetical protein